MKISVVIPTYNHAQWLPESISSALAQTFKPWEVIVVDDGSKDDTKEVVSQFPVRYVFQDNAGLSAARNKGIEVATGDWIALLDADDVWLPTKLERQVSAIRDEEFCYCAATRFFPDGHTEHPECFFGNDAIKTLRHHNFIDPSSVLAKRDAFLRVGGFNRSMPAGEDWEMWLRLSNICKFVGVPERLLRYRVLGNSMSSNPDIHLRSMEAIVAAGTSHLRGLARVLAARRMRSVRYSMVAVKYREKGDFNNTLRLAVRGFREWPSPFYDRAFKILLLEMRRRVLGR
ncbi:MAG TPA: glycosyltransferase family A protein [Terriglobales bacterium]|nr:glycosyltransferase family A protein [Terriglobales bacterium]